MNNCDCWLKLFWFVSSRKPLVFLCGVTAQRNTTPSTTASEAPFSYILAKDFWSWALPSASLGQTACDCHCHLESGPTGDCGALERLVATRLSEPTVCPSSPPCVRAAGLPDLGFLLSFGIFAFFVGLFCGIVIARCGRRGSSTTASAQLPTVRRAIGKGVVITA